VLRASDFEFKYPESYSEPLPKGLADALRMTGEAFNLKAGSMPAF
jgi:hypothetical protein